MILVSSFFKVTSSTNINRSCGKAIVITHSVLLPTAYKTNSQAVNVSWVPLTTQTSTSTTKPRSGFGFHPCVNISG